MEYLNTLSRKSLLQKTSPRYELRRSGLESQTRKESVDSSLAEKIELLDEANTWTQTKTDFVLLGIPEDIGVRANMGRPGAAEAWNAMLSSLAGLPLTEASFSHKLCIAGNVVVDDLMVQAENLNPKDHKDRFQMSELVREVDVRVQSVLEGIFAAVKIPVVIGGGHNNVLPILRAYKTIHQKALNIINIDAHTDLRLPVGRHSGNGFSHALKEGCLDQYTILGLQQVYLTTEMLQQFTEDNIQHVLLEDLTTGAIDKVIPTAPYGLELDMDVVADFPSSAQNPRGLTFSEFLAVVEQVVSSRRPAYIHICEAAPCFGYPGQVGKALMHVVQSVVR